MSNEDNEEEFRHWDEYLPKEALPDTGPKEFRVGQVWAVAHLCAGTLHQGVYRVLSTGSDGYVSKSKRLAGGGDGLHWIPAKISKNASHAVLVHDAVPMEVGQTRRGHIRGASDGEAKPYPTAATFLVIAKRKPRDFRVQTPDGRKWSFVENWPSVLVEGSVKVPAPAVSRKVSLNGREWADYDSLVDADPFESYLYRSTASVMMTSVIGPIMSACAYAGGCKLSVGRLGDMCFEHHVDSEIAVARKMDQYYNHPGKQLAEPRPAHRSHATMFGGVWNIGR